MGVFRDNQQKKIAYGFLFTAGTLLAFRYLMPVAAPFLLSFFLVYLSYPMLAKLQKKTGIRKEIFLAAILVLFLLLVAAVLVFLFRTGMEKLGNIGENWNFFLGTAQNFLGDCCHYMEGKFGVDAGRMEEVIIQKMNVLIQQLQVNFFPKAAGVSWNYIEKVLAAGAFLGVGFISCMLLCKDFEEISGKLMGNPVSARLLVMFEKIAGMVGVYVKSQLLILTVISILCVTFLGIAGIQGALFLGILAGILDALPFIGTGIVLVPTALWQLISGHPKEALLVAALYLLCIGAREFLEPKLMGKGLGIYPVVMLFGIYGGVKVFGLAGIIKGPLFLLVVKEGFALLNLQFPIDKSEKFS